MIVLCAVAIVVAFAARDRLGMVLGALTVLSFWAFALDPQSAIWDQRLMPFWYISIHLAAGWLVGYIAWRWAFRLPARYRWAAYFAEIAAQPADAVEGDRAEPEPEPEPEPVSAHESVDAARSLEADDPRYFSRRLVQATCAVALLGLLSTVPGLDQAPRQRAAPIDGRQPGERLGRVQLLGLPGPVRLARVPRPDEDDGGRRQALRLRARDVGVLGLRAALRHARGADASALLDQQLRRLDGGAAHGVFADDARTTTSTSPS